MARFNAQVREDEAVSEVCSKGSKGSTGGKGGGKGGGKEGAREGGKEGCRAGSNVDRGAPLQRDGRASPQCGAGRITVITDADYRCVWRPCPALEEEPADEAPRREATPRDPGAALLALIPSE